jgi:dTMP kinase
MDLGWSNDPSESFRLFQSRVLEEYDGIVGEFGLKVINATRRIADQQSQVRRLVARYLEDKDERTRGTAD